MQEITDVVNAALCPLKVTLGGQLAEAARAQPALIQELTDYTVGVQLKCREAVSEALGPLLKAVGQMMLEAARKDMARLRKQLGGDGGRAVAEAELKVAVMRDLLVRAGTVSEIERDAKGLMVKTRNVVDPAVAAALKPEE